jgi:hypothetical protein
VAQQKAWDGYNGRLVIGPSVRPVIVAPRSTAVIGAIYDVIFACHTPFLAV